VPATAGPVPPAPGTGEGRLNRAMLNEAHTVTVSMLEYKLVECGGQLVRVAAPGTSQTCAPCGHRDPASRKSIKFVCTSCGWVGHADSNAAVNIYNAAGPAVHRRGAHEPMGSGASTAQRAV
jgi:putative transposase